MTSDSVRMSGLTPAQVTKILAAAGSRRITEAMILADIEAGAPVNPDGTIHLIQYTAWLVRELASGTSAGDPDGN